MSRAPLISRSIPAVDQGSYGAVRTYEDRSTEDLSDPSDDTFDHIRKRDTQKNYTSDSDVSYEASRENLITANSGTIKRRTGDRVVAIAEDTTDDDDDPPDNSRYPQVRASVSATDDVAASISTPRMWILSLICALLGSGSNLFFSLRYPSVTITPVIALVIVHPLGLAWDRLFKREDDPAEAFDCGTLVNDSTHRQGLASASRSTRLRRWFAQGRWNEKEHACVYISSNVSFGFAFATDVRYTRSIPREKPISSNAIR
ncbi:MAG: hypothetical protein Q9224_003226 [Gallowayella concinna]